jgi:hypothetical protein
MKDSARGKYKVSLLVVRESYLVIYRNLLSVTDESYVYHISGMEVRTSLMIMQSCNPEIWTTVGISRTGVLNAENHQRIW